MTPERDRGDEVDRAHLRDREQDERDRHHEERVEGDLPGRLRHALHDGEHRTPAAA
jgi:hypothetical protein